MADRYVIPPRSAFRAVRIIAPLTLALAVSACNQASNPFSKVGASNQTSADLRTQIARKQALARAAARVEQQNQEIPAPVQTASASDKKTFKPNLFSLFQRRTMAEPTEFRKPVAVAANTSRDLKGDRLAEAPKPLKGDRLAVPVPTAKPETGQSKTELAALAMPRKIETPQVKTPGSRTPSADEPMISSSAPLARFRAKLAALKSGKRTKPVTIVHIGDSHVASDSFSQGIRRALQAEFGDAGRGMVIPAGAFKYGFADQVKLVRKGPWRAQTALKTKSGGRFGLSGVNVASSSTGAAIILTSRSGPFDAVEVTVATGPRQGSFKVSVGGKQKKFSARAASKGSKTFRFEAQGEEVRVSPAGGGTTTVLNWATLKNRPGIRYANLGLIGATVDITKRFNGTLVTNDIRALDPDLIVYGFGTNEGFNDNLNLKRYRTYAGKFLDTLVAAAPNADTVIIGAADGLRRRARGGKSCGGGWYIPKKMQPLRATMKQMAADRKDGYWDWSAAMGGPCSANKWAAKGFAARDRVHLTSKGYHRSANAFAAWLANADSPVRVARN